MAAEYAALIRQAQPNGPYNLAGFSSGGVIAYEVARQLTALGLPVNCLVILDTRAPARRPGAWGRKLRQLPADLFWYWRYVVRSDQRGQLLRRQVGEFRRMVAAHEPTGRDSRALMEQMIAEIGDFSQRHLAVARAHLLASRLYQPRPYGGRLVLLRAQVQLLLTDHDPLLGWDALVPDGVEVRTVPGRHEEMFKEPHVRTLAAQIAGVLAPLS